MTIKTRTRARSGTSRDVVVFLGLLPLLAVLDVAFWIADPERRLVRTALMSGLVVGRVAVGAAW